MLFELLEEFSTRYTLVLVRRPSSMFRVRVRTETKMSDQRGKLRLNIPSQPEQNLESQLLHQVSLVQGWALSSAFFWVLRPKPKTPGFGLGFGSKFLDSRFWVGFSTKPKTFLRQIN